MKKIKLLKLLLILFISNCFSQVSCENLLDTLIPKSLKNYEKTNKEAKQLKQGDFVYIKIPKENIDLNENWQNCFIYEKGWDLRNPSILELALSNGKWGDRKVNFINPKTIKDLKLEILYSNKSTPKSCAFKDKNGNIYGYLEHKKFKKISFVNRDSEKKLKELKANFKIDNFIVFDKIDLKKDHYNYYNYYNYYKVIDLNTSLDRPRLIIKEYNSKINTPSKESYEIDCRKIERIYYKDCYEQVWDYKKNKYNQYLKSNFTAKEISAILNDNVFIGMSEKALYESIGKPIETNMQKGSNYTFKQLVYGNGIFIYIENRKVNSFQNFESFKRLR